MTTPKDVNKQRMRPLIFQKGLGRTLLTWFLVLALVPVIIVSIISYRKAHNSLFRDAEKALNSLVDLKTIEIKAYFDEILTDLRLQADLNANITFMEELLEAYKESGVPSNRFIAGKKWAEITAEKASDLKAYQKTFNFNDIYLIDLSGNILFNTTGGEDLGTNLFFGTHRDSKFAESCRNTLKTGKVTFSDYENHPPTGSGQVVGFIASTVDNEEGKIIGVMAFQFPIAEIDKIMQARTGLGSTAETYLVGPDLRLRSNSILQTKKTVLREPVKTKQTRLWENQIKGKLLSEESEHPVMIYQGPHGNEVLGVHRGIDFAGIPFGVIAEIEKHEAFASVDALFRIVILLLLITGAAVVLVAVYIAGRIVRPIQALYSGVKRVAGGEMGFEIDVNVKNEIGELAVGFNNMVRNLLTTIQENDAKNQLMTGQANLNVRMRGELDIGSLGKNIISFLCEFLNAKVGTIYMANESGILKLIGSYAYIRQKNIPNHFNPGEGLVGQAALEKKYILLTDCPEDYISIHSGMGKAVPKNLLVYPLRIAGDVKGVVELGSFHDFSKHNIAYLDQVQESIAIALNSVLSRNRTAMLLKQTQKQAEELQVQQEELRQANEELEEHTGALEASEARLQAQQEELRQTNEELEEQAQRLEEQKVDIEKKNNELEEARRLLEEKARDLELSSKYKSEFLANMSHELRTPLNSILLLARHMADNRDGSLTPSHIESAQSIYTSGAELLTLINEVLDLSKVESGKMELHIENVALEDISNAMKRHFSPIALEKALTWDVEIASNMPKYFRTDRLRAEQVLKNFLSNAFKFTESGSVKLRIYRPGNRADETTFLMRSGMIPMKTVAFSVVDTGLGIPEEKQKVIFDAFQQADGTTSRKYGGTGLGLSISKELSKILGGEIRMTSTPGKGSTFTLYLPEPRVSLSKTGDFDEVETLETKPVRLIKPLQMEKRFSGVQKDMVEAIEDDRKHITPEDKSILIIEDDPAYVKILRNLAREHGFKCLVAGDGETGLHFADFYTPGAIILDIGLPRLNGWAVMTRLKENPRTRHIPVHFISASDRQMDALRMGAVDFLTKPGSPEMLDKVYEKLDNVISKQVKDLLVVEDNEEQANAIARLVGNGDVRVTIASTADQAFKNLLTGKFDCMILDLGLPDMSGVNLLNKTRNNDAICHIPIIIYTGRELSQKERKIIDEYAESTIIKGADSHQRLLDETALFLHRVEANLPEEQQKMLRMLHDKEAILANKKILIVDDDMRNVFSLKKVLTEKEIHVLVGKNGKEGLEVLEKNPDTNLVLMDIMMPEMNGYEAMRAIRNQERFKDLPIIALTAKAMKGDRSKCIDAGASDYLAKPVDTDRLFSMLRVWLY